MGRANVTVLIATVLATDPPTEIRALSDRESLNQHCANYSRVPRCESTGAMADNLTPAQRSKNMSRIRRRDTAPELAIRRALWAAGHRGYRVDRGSLPGRPDVAWGRAKVAVFIDGAFWHGHPSAYTPGKSGDYWDEKIERNRKRDEAANSSLRAMGWTVIRMWDFEVKQDLDSCIERVERALNDSVEIVSAA